METSLVIANGRKQIVLTPETEHEKQILKCLSDGGHTLSVLTGSFYARQGGWHAYSHYKHPGEDTSTFLVMEPVKLEVPDAEA